MGLGAARGDGEEEEPTSDQEEGGDREDGGQRILGYDAMPCRTMPCNSTPMLLRAAANVSSGQLRSCNPVRYEWMASAGRLSSLSTQPSLTYASAMRGCNTIAAAYAACDSARDPAARSELARAKCSVAIAGRSKIHAKMCAGGEIHVWRGTEGSSCMPSQAAYRTPPTAPAHKC